MKRLLPLLALLRRVHCDETVYDHDTPQGLPDNTNPSGALVEGYAICLGYASSVQLLDGSGPLPQ